VGDFISEQVAVEAPAEDSSVLSDVERALVRYAVEELGGAFTINRLYEQFKGEISKRQLTKTAKRWERRGWLTEPGRDEHGHKIGRMVTDDLKALLHPPARGTAQR
jgi:hypothetical protein